MREAVDGGRRAGGRRAGIRRAGGDRAREGERALGLRLLLLGVDDDRAVGEVGAGPDVPQVALGVHLEADPGGGHEGGAAKCERGLGRAPAGRRDPRRARGRVHLGAQRHEVEQGAEARLAPPGLEPERARVRDGGPRREGVGPRLQHTLLRQVEHLVSALQVQPVRADQRARAPQGDAQLAGVFDPVRHRRPRQDRRRIGRGDQPPAQRVAVRGVQLEGDREVRRRVGLRQPVEVGRRRLRHGHVASDGEGRATSDAGRLEAAEVEHDRVLPRESGAVRVRVRLAHGRRRGLEPRLAVRDPRRDREIPVVREGQREGEEQVRRGGDEAIRAEHDDAGLDRRGTGEGLAQRVSDER